VLVSWLAARKSRCRLPCSLTPLARREKESMQPHLSYQLPPSHFPSTTNRFLDKLPADLNPALIAVTNLVESSGAKIDILPRARIGRALVDNPRSDRLAIASDLNLAATNGIQVGVRGGPVLHGKSDDQVVAVVVLAAGAETGEEEGCLPGLG